nr:MAG TPA: hypothetical protein [Caudoviricetes sp.]
MIYLFMFLIEVKKKEHRFLKQVEYMFYLVDVLLHKCI